MQTLPFRRMTMIITTGQIQEQTGAARETRWLQTGRVWTTVAGNIPVLMRTMMLTQTARTPTRIASS
ncbi:hypothetical protein DPMN_144183 [Dreissena polymorpha]|uniref:Uncharacterized protein n=1 Tax=Dreissena polymorpha TaxID=45954 RepID=A0A9D4GHU2_DREPO|nr:hypothetical protein DPMN_144183 [Dreissena polymorpha]